MTLFHLTGSACAAPCGAQLLSVSERGSIARDWIPALSGIEFRAVQAPSQDAGASNGIETPLGSWQRAVLAVNSEGSPQTPGDGGLQVHKQVMNLVIGRI